MERILDLYMPSYQGSDALLPRMWVRSLSRARLDVLSVMFLPDLPGQGIAGMVIIRPQPSRWFLYLGIGTAAAAADKAPCLTRRHVVSSNINLLASPL